MKTFADLPALRAEQIERDNGGCLGPAFRGNRLLAQKKNPAEAGFLISLVDNWIRPLFPRGHPS